MTGKRLQTVSKEYCFFLAELLKVKKDLFDYYYRIVHAHHGLE